MTSRRPMTRSYSGNGRTSSFGEEEGSSSNGRSESRTTYLSNVRPENRSTLCTVMAQLTEDIQPSFETTLKSKAVSENCNVKFTCVVSGYPAPELKWYKDDMEMDRYCGLPKYEIHRNGKIHTLRIYNCTLDDAAIYQVSASNSKGIVSCSGVLEVGTMNEFQIHQRFFAKLKQKAEKKRKDFEAQTKREDKENVQEAKKQISPERPPRKRHVPPLEKTPAVMEPDAVENMGAAAGLEVKETAPVTTKDGEQNEKISPSEETLAKKKIKISNGIDAEAHGSSSYCGRSHVVGIGGENSYDGGISLAQFLAEALQSQAAEEEQKSPQGETPKATDIPIVNASMEKDREQERTRKEKEEQVKALQEEREREKRREKELATKKERERERPSAASHATPHTKHGSDVKHHSKAHKDHDHHNIQASISSMIHTVKDFLFGKSKKDGHDQVESKESKESALDCAPASTRPPQPETPPSFERNQESRPLAEGVPMVINTIKEPPETVHAEKQLMSVEQHEHKHVNTALNADLLPAHKMPPDGIEESTGHQVSSVKEVEEDAAEAIGVSVLPEGSSPGDEISLSGLHVLPEADSQVASVMEGASMELHLPDFLVASPQPNTQAATDESFAGEDASVSPQTKAPCEEEPSPTPTLIILEESQTLPQSVISASGSHSLGENPNKEGEPDTESTHSSHISEEEKAEVKSSKQPHSDINTCETTELRMSVKERIGPCDSTTPNQVLSPPSIVAAYGTEMDNMKEGPEHASTIQEMNAGFAPTVAPESLENLKMQPECTTSLAEDSTEVHNLSPIQSPNAEGFKCSEDRSELTEVLICALAVDSEVNSHNGERTQRPIFLEGESTEVSNESMQIEVEKEKKDPVKDEECDDSKNLSVTQNMEGHATVLEGHSIVTQQDSKEDTIPQIQICTIEETTDIKPIMPYVRPNEHFVIPRIDIMEPELKECTLPLTILALNKQEKESTVLSKHDATHVSAVISQEDSVPDFPHLLPAQKAMQNDSNLSPTENVTDVDKTEILEKPHAKSSEELPQMDFASIPVINVSCADDKDCDLNVYTNMSDVSQPLGSPTGALFVVPPISVTCHDSDSELRPTTQGESTGRETSSGDNVTIKPEKTQGRKQNLEEMAEKILKDGIPSVLYNALMPKVGDNGPSLSKTTQDHIFPEILKTKPLNESKIDNHMSVEDLQRNRSPVDRLYSKPPAHPSLSPASLRKFMSKASPDSDSEAGTTVPVITMGDRQSDKADDDLSGGSTPTSSLSCDSSPRLKRRDSLSLIRSATPEELASGARRKIFIPKPKEEGEGAVVGGLDAQSKKETPYMSPSQARRAALLQAPAGQNTPPMERRSPLVSRRKVTLEVPKVVEETPKEEPDRTRQEEKPAEKKPDPLKAPQVIRKIRGEPFPDASGHLKLWCQFFNVLSDSTIKWYRDEEEILELTRSGADESQVALAIVLASSQDCGVYGCSISNEHGTDTTDYLLSIDILSEILLRDDLEVGEEIEMTPLLFTKGLADCGSWGEKYFGRIMTETVQIGEGCSHKASRVRVIYGLDPIFESGSACVIKVQNPIAYGTKQESKLAERNGEITKQECKVQNMIREYCKIFAAEARIIESFGFSLEVIPQYLMYRPANSVPYATVEADLKGDFLKYCMMEPKGKLITQTGSEVEQKCSTFQHWIYQWTHGNLLVTRLEGVETKITNVRVVTKSKGYQGLTERGSPEVFEQFMTQHQCNYFCGLLSLKPLKTMDSLQQPTKTKGSRSPLLNRKLGSSPQMQRKGQSPQMLRKANSSPKVTRKALETEGNNSSVKPKPAESVDVVETR